MMDPNNKFEFNSYFDTERVNKGVNQIFNNQYNAETNSKMCYSSYLGEKEENSYSELISSLTKDPEFIDMFNEFKGRERLSYEFEELSEEKQLEIVIKCYFIVKTQKDQVIDEYWRIKTEIEEKQKVAMNFHIEKYKNEAYSYKCERDELKQLFNNLKARKDAKEKDFEKLSTKCKEYKEKISNLENTILMYETEKKETEGIYTTEISELKIKNRKLAEQLEELTKKYKETEEELEIQKKKTEDFKLRYESLSIQNKELTERNIKLMRYGKKNHMSNFSSQIATNDNIMPLDALDMTQLIHDDHTTEKPSEGTMTMRIGVSNLKSISKEIRPSKLFFNRKEENIKMETRQSKVWIIL